tara:strand:- start:56 stop:247 length:192 start_codon:yes stop_codon:yes gene_type:complete
LITDDILRGIDDAKEQVKDTLASGASETYADYKNLVGVMYGLDMAAGIVNTELKKYLKEEEED